MINRINQNLALKRDNELDEDRNEAQNILTDTKEIRE